MFMETDIVKEQVLGAWKKAVAHRNEAKQDFENWLLAKGVEGKVVLL